ncbi:MAG: S1C family serine protease [Vulcanimicrobiaceae bacterium]
MTATLNEAIELVRRSTVTVEAGRRSSGAGVVVDRDGLVVSNAHVVSSRDVRVRTADGKHYRARVIKRDADRDLASLRIDAPDLAPIRFRDSSTLRAAELVFSVGNPYGLIAAASCGVIHSTSVAGRRWLEADVRLGPGSSGGPLADAAGKLIGINSMVAYGSLALAVPSNAVRAFLGIAERLNLGVQTVPVEARAGSATFRGLLIVKLVEPAGIARTGGLMVGDTIVAFAGRGVATAADLAGGLANASEQATLTARVVRAGKVVEFVLPLNRRARYAA